MVYTFKVFKYGSSVRLVVSGRYLTTYPSNSSTYGCSHEQLDDAVRVLGVISR